MMLKDKVAIVYGAAGSIGSATAHAFAKAGARVFVTGHKLAPVASLAKAIGGTAEAAEVDALDDKAVEAFVARVVERAGRIDISFDAVGIPDKEVVGTPFVELSVEKFLRPVTSYALAYFNTARAAARRMAAQKSGVIMTISALHARSGYPLNGGYGAAQGAKEALTRALSAELSSLGVRIVGLRPQAIPESSTIQDAFEARKAALGMTWDQWYQTLASRNHARRLMDLQEVSDVAVFAASDHARGLTGTTINLSLGTVDD